MTVQFATAALFWLAGNVFCVASIVSMNKGHVRAAFRNIMLGLGAMLVSLLILP